MSSQINYKSEVLRMSTIPTGSVFVYTTGGGVSGGSGGSGVSGGSGNYTIATNGLPQYQFSSSSFHASTFNSSLTSGLVVDGVSEFNGTVKLNGVDLGKLLEKIEDRLAILVPDPNKLEKFEALKRAYEHYKVLEALCEETK